MKTNYFLVLLAILCIAAFGCTQTAKSSDRAMASNGKIMGKEAGIGDSMYSGKVLAGTESTKYLEFNKADYEKALNEKKKIYYISMQTGAPHARRSSQKHLRLSMK